MVLSFRSAVMSSCARVHAGHHVSADPRRPGRAVKPASPERGRSEAERLDGPEGRPTIRGVMARRRVMRGLRPRSARVSAPASRKLK